MSSHGKEKGKSLQQGMWKSKAKHPENPGYPQSSAESWETGSEAKMQKASIMFPPTESNQDTPTHKENSPEKALLFRLTLWTGSLHVLS